MAAIRNLKEAIASKQKKPTYKNHGGGMGAKRYAGTMIADKSTNIPIAFVIDGTETRLLFEKNPDPQRGGEDDDSNEMWLYLPDIPGFHERGVVAKWSPQRKGKLLGKHFEIYYDHKSGAEMSYEPTEKTIKVVFEEPSEALVVAEPIAEVVAEPVAQTLEQCVMATLCWVPQNVKTILESVQSKFPTATKTIINSIIYKNTKTLKKHTMEGVSAPLWSVGS